MGLCRTLGMRIRERATAILAVGIGIGDAIAIVNR